MVDNALSFRIAVLLRAAGRDAAHVRDIQLGAAPDAVILEYALVEGRVIISADSDFGTLLAQQETRKPSFILLRWPGLRLADEQARIILANLPNVIESLESGAVVVIEPKRVRVRSLPIGKWD
ncbi:MAG TPA: DUF5615 family PIN-like protein [Candidatus Limnocylindrales bacterium]|nr:DUF5615 family PIN-like protein [Candidatus Limnocylindrales bacterium]